MQDCSTPAAQLVPMIEDLSSPIGGIANSASTEYPIPVVYSAHTLPQPPVDCATGTPLPRSTQRCSCSQAGAQGCSYEKVTPLHRSQDGESREAFQ